MILSGSTLYGMTVRGGDDDAGVIFSINTNGNSFSLLHEFAGGIDDGSHPYGSLILSESTLYGMTSNGGDKNDGVVFSINTDGSSFSLLHEFAGGIDDGDSPDGSLILYGSILYGMTGDGGDNDDGVVFSINTDGSSFSLLHEFNEGNDDGGSPDGSLLQSGSTLYGMTYYGGDDMGGVIFALLDVVPTTIPTLNEWGMIILFLLTIAASFMAIRRRRA